MKVHRFCKFLTLSLLIIASGCSGEKTHVYRIGVSQCSDDEWRDKLNQEIRREAMAHDNIEVEIRSSRDDNQTQIDDVLYFAENDFDLLIIAPNEVEAITPIIEEVYDKGMPVIVFDREMSSDKYTARLEGDNTGLGVSVARYARARSASEKLRFLEITGLGSSSPARKRHEGFISEIENMPNAEIVASVDGRWNNDRAREITDSVIRKHPEINVIYAHNDFMAIGASEALKNLKRDDVMIIGIDGTPEVGIRAVADSMIDATFVYPTDGFRLVRKALTILEGNPYSREEIIPATSAVDLTNADILLQQNHQFDEEKSSIPILNDRLEDVRSRHNYQTIILYCVIFTVLILLLSIFLLFRNFKRIRKLHSQLANQNHELEEERDKQNELYRKLETATQAKLVFFTNISHDLRTPLTLIADPVERLSKVDYLTPEDSELMKIANKNVHILRRLINQILDFRKFENGRLELSLTTVDLGRTFMEWAQSFVPLAAKRGIGLTVDTSEGDNVYSSIDLEKIERVVFNLMSNAFRHTDKKGSIILRLKVKESCFEFSISDSGSGIPENELNNIFNRFYQVETREGNINYTGSGIGLAVSKAFVELHGGSITVESTVGVGSKFTVTIPLRKKEVEKKSYEEERESTPVSESSYNPDLELDNITRGIPLTDRQQKTSEEEAKPLLLIIEDNKDMQELIRLSLCNEYEILTAANGAIGLRVATREVPDIIICDVMMPVMDGFECCSRMKSEVATSHIPVLMLTACALDEQRIKGYSEGADSYLSKPFNAELIRTRVRNLIENRKRVKDAFGLSIITRKDRRREKDIKKNLFSESLPDFAVSSDIDSEFYDRFLEIVSQEIGNSQLSIDHIASKMGLGQSQFGRKIKALTGYAPVSLIRLIRLHKARTMLISTEKSISEICYEVGFSSPAYFSKSYLDIFRESPTVTRAASSPAKKQ